MDPGEAKVRIERFLLAGDLAGARQVAEQFLQSREKSFQDAALFYSAFCLQYHPLDPQPAQAVSRYQKLLKEHPQSVLREETLFQLGQCYQADPLWPNPEHAITWYAQLLAEFPQGSRAMRAMYEKGLCQESVVGNEIQLKEALVTYQGLANREDAEPWRTRAIYRQARLKERLGDTAGAVQDYERFLQMKNRAEQETRRSEVQMRLAMLLINEMNRVEDGRQLLSALLSETKDGTWRVVAQQIARRKGTFE